MREGPEVRLYFRTEDFAPGDGRGRQVVVIDVLRASSTIVTALAAGAAAVRPVSEVDEARRLAAELRTRGGRVLLAGERQAETVAGFDRGNSPLEFRSASLEGYEVVLTTSNGTRALIQAREGSRILVGSLLNGSAVVADLLSYRLPVTLLCAGTLGAFSYDDFLTGGFLAARLAEAGARLDDRARAAADAYAARSADLTEAFLASGHGQRLVAKGLFEDVRFCAQVDQFALVPVYQATAGSIKPGG